MRRKPASLAVAALAAMLLHGCARREPPLNIPLTERGRPLNDFNARVRGRGAAVVGGGGVARGVR
jgi:hypothetical protein